MIVIKFLRVFKTKKIKLKTFQPYNLHQKHIYVKQWQLSKFEFFIRRHKVAEVILRFSMPW